MTDWTIEVFYDRGCSLCRTEIEFLKRFDRKGRIRATDIDDSAFRPPAGLTWNQMMERIYGRLPSGELLEGVDVFRRLYAALGLGWLVAISRLPGICTLLDRAYRVFARYRLARRKRCQTGSCIAGPHGWVSCDD